MNSTQIFGISLAIGLVAICVVFSLVWIAVRFFSKSRSLEGFNAFCSAMGVVFGTAGTLAGAYATLQVADLGLRLTERDSAREASILVEERAGHAVELYAELALALSDLYSSGLLVRESHAPERRNLAPARAFSIERYKGALGRLIGALEQIQKSAFAQRCFVIVNGNSDTFMASVLAMADTNWVITPSLRDLEGLSTLLSLAQHKVESNPNPLIVVSIAHARQMREAQKMPGAIEGFLFSGAILFLDEGKNGAANFGAAMLADLAGAIPTAAEVRECLLRDYESWVGDDAAPSLDYDPGSGLGEVLTGQILPVLRTELFFLAAQSR